MTDGKILWLKDVILFAVSTGLRLTEITTLRWRDIDFESGFLSIRNQESFRTKSGNERRVPLVCDALNLVQRRSDERLSSSSEHVFTYADGTSLVPTYVSKRLKYYARLARLPESVHFHTLRHTCASWLVMRGISLVVDQHVLGHGDMRTTQKYAHLAPDVMKEAMEMAFGGRR